VRPEKITLVPKGDAVPDGSNVLHGKVIVAAFLGVSIQYVIQTAGGEELNVFTQNVSGSEPEALSVGRDVQLAWQPEHTFVVARG
jgi:spermidine/putrescine transport system ATP-binding protein